MKVLFFGSYAREYPRNKIIREGLRLAGVEVLECNVPFEENRRFYDRYRTLLRNLRSIGNGWEAMVAPEFNYKNMPLAFAAARLCRRPLIFDPLVSCYNTNVEDRKRVSPKGRAALMQRALDRTGFMLADRVWADTGEHLRYFHEKFHVPLQKLCVVPVGVDDEVFYPRPDSAKKEGFVVTFLGSYVPLHGLEHILGAASLLKRDSEIRFKLIGNGQTFEHIRDLHHRENLHNVELIPPVPYRRIPEVLSDADICLGIFGGTDKARRVIPNKVYQALAMRKPVITGESPAVREAFESRVHLLTCKMADPTSLAHVIRSLLNTPDLRRRLASQGHELVMKKFSRKAIGEKIKGILEQVIEGKSK